VFDASAQKIKQTEGKHNFLKGQNDLSVKFVYAEEMKVN
jgi:hypothetical protein